MLTYAMPPFSPLPQEMFSDRGARTSDLKEEKNYPGVASPCFPGILRSKQPETLGKPLTTAEKMGVILQTLGQLP